MTAARFSFAGTRALRVLALGLLTGCSNCTDVTRFELEVTPAEAGLDVGERVRLDVLVRVIPELESTVPESVSITFSREDDRIAFATLADDAPRGEVTLLMPCGPGERAILECAGSVFVLRTGPAMSATENVRVTARSLAAGLAFVDIRLTGDGIVRDAGMDAGECPGVACENGTLNPEDGCVCECDPGFAGEACDRRQSLVRTLVGDADGRGTPRVGFVDGPKNVARMDTPVGVDVAPDGRVFIADQGNDALRVYDPATEELGTVLSDGIDHPQAVAVGDDTTVYVGFGETFAETALVRLDLSGAAPVVTPFAAGSFAPTDIIRDLSVIDGTLWVVDATSVHRVEVAGEGTATDTFSLGRVNFNAISAGPEDTLYITADGNVLGDTGPVERGAVYQLDPETASIDSLFGYGLFGAPIDGNMGGQPALTGRLGGPTDVVYFPLSPFLYLVERPAHRVRRYRSPRFDRQWVSEHVAGMDGTAFHGIGEGFEDPDDAVPADEARFNEPVSMAASPAGRSLFVIDSLNHALRRVDL